MKVVIWIVQIIVTIAFFGAGITKLITPYEEMRADPNMGWVNDFSALQIQIISILEVLGALGVILPMIVKKSSRSSTNSLLRCIRMPRSTCHAKCQHTW